MKTGCFRLVLKEQLILLLAAVLLISSVSLASSEDPETGSETEVSLGLFSLNENTFRLSLHGIPKILDQLSEATDSDRYGIFYYDLVLDESIPVRFTGKMDLRGSKEWYDWRLQSTFICREKKTSKQQESYFSNEDTANWVLTMEKYDKKQFLPGSLTVASFHIYPDKDREHALSFSFPMEEVLTDAVLCTPQFHADGMLVVEVPDPKSMVARIDIPKMRTDFSCFSKDGKNKVFRFLIKAVVSSYEWVQITIDGEHASSPEEILFYAGEFHPDADESNLFSYQDKTVPISDAGLSFTENGIEVRIVLPEDCPHDFRQLRYFALATNGRDIYSKYYIKPY